MEKSVLKDFTKYVSLNVLGMIGLSCYILADTFFISKALGATGIAALNFSIPVYSVMHGIGLMIGIGGATRYSIVKSQHQDQRANSIFSHCMGLGLLIGMLFVLIGIIGPKFLAVVLGADATTLPLTKTYLTTMLCFAPFFIINNVVLAFVRNDHNPNLPMIAMLVGSFSNIILDYIFMFPLKMGMFGAAFATGLAPIISISVLSIHFIKGENNFKFVQSKVCWSSIWDIFSLGLSSFITEVSSAVVLITFNLVILNLEGNLGVASYGIIANIALVGISIFTGIAQGIQPLISKAYGMSNNTVLEKIIKFALVTSLVIAVAIYFGVYFTSDGIIRIFNSEQNLKIAQLTKTGLRIYFIGFFFAGINIIISTYLSAIEQTRNAFIISILRGCVVIVPSVLLLSRLWEMTGIWLAFVFTELIVTMIAIPIANSNKEVEIGDKRAGTLAHITIKN